jgi:ankyrin repeat protein
MDDYLKYGTDDSSDSGDRIPNNSAYLSRINSYGGSNEDDEMLRGMSNNEDMKLCIRLITSAYKVRDFDLIDEIISDMVSKSNIPGLTKLHSVSGYGFSELVERYLSDLKMDPNAKCIFNELGSITPLHFCAGIGPDPISPDRNKCIYILVKHGADINHPTTRSDTALHWACKVSDKSIAEDLLKNGANINALNSDNCTCAHGAAFYKNMDILKLLIENGVDTSVADCSGKTLLHLLCKDTVENKPSIRSDYDLLLNDEFETIEKIDEEAVRDKKQADTMKLIQIITCLVQRMSSENLNIRDMNGFTPVMYACEYGNVNILKLLIDHGADINITSSEGVTCLLLAIVNAEVAIVKCLIESGFDTKKDNCSYLTDAAFLNDMDIVKLLIDAGFDVNETKQDETGAILNPLWAGMFTFVFH